MKPAVTFRNELEVLDGVGHVYSCACNPGGGKRAIQQLPGRSHEGTPKPIFFVTGLFTDQHQISRFWAFPENGLRRFRVQRTRFTACRG
jgi:hypothetical protein